MHKTKKFWITVGVLYALFIAPNAMIIKTATDTTDPYYWNFVRFLVVLIACTPFVIKYWRKITNKTAFPWVMGAAVFMFIAVTTYTVAIKLSLASYVSVITLINPICLVTIAPLFTKERISRRAMTGVTLAALGAIIVVLLPIAIYQNGFAFYPVATLLCIVNALCYTLAIIMLRRANENGAPLAASIGVNAFVATIASLILFVLLGNHQQVPSLSTFLPSALYSGIGVCLLARALSIKIFENTGAAFTSALTYLDSFISILLPVLILGEKLSIITIIGGMLILLGLYVVESHKHPHTRHHFIWHHH